MKKILIPAILLLSLPLLAADKFFLALQGDFQQFTDADYKSIYGSSAFMPEFALSARIFKQIHLRAAVSFLKQSGSTIAEDVGGPQTTTHSQQTFIFIGPEYAAAAGKKMQCRLYAGALFASYKETTEDSSWQAVSGNAGGFEAGTGLWLSFGARIQAGVIVAFNHITDTITIDGESVGIKLGGFKAGVGLGIRL